MQPYISSISSGQALLIALVAGLTIISWIYSFFFAFRALIISALVGAILGDAKHALMFGAAAELIYLGLINAAGVIPPSPLGPGVFGTVIYLTSKEMTIGTAISLSLPFAIFIQFLVTVIFTINSPMGRIHEVLIQKERFKLYRFLGHITGIMLFVAGFAVGLGAGFGYQAFGDAIAKIPVWLQSGLGVAGAMLPAMGFAVVLRLMLKKEYMPFLLVGFTLVVIFQAVGTAKPNWGFSLVAISIAAASIALVTFNSGILGKQEAKNRMVAPVSDKSLKGEEDGI